jgi:RNA polymerase sigma-70 factor (ECF subfamily)
MSEHHDEELEAAWREHRRYVLDVAYRLLGTMTDAEDVVQEAYARLLRTAPGEIDDVRGWLVVVVTRLCLDQLRSARVRHAAYVGPWLPEPVVEPVDGSAVDPADRVTLDDSVRMALLVVLERLTPAERAAFVLHDVFGFSFDQVGTIVGRTPAAVRQLASRARKHVAEQTEPARFHVDAADLRRIVDRFITAATEGDMAALRDVLDPKVAGWTDTGGGLPAAPRKLITGVGNVAPLLIRFLRDFEVKLEPIDVNGEPGAIVVRIDGGELIAVLAFEARQERITRIHSVANPAKLAQVRAALAQG